MKILALALGGALAISVLLNMVLAGKVSRLDEAETGPRSRARETAVPARNGSPIPAASEGSNALLLQEIRQLRREVAELKGQAASEEAGSSPAAVVAADAPSDLPAWILNDPVVAGALAERTAARQASRKYWWDLERVGDLKSSIGLGKARELGAKLTAEYMGLDAGTQSSFVAAALQAAQELDRAYAERRDAEAKLKAEVPDKEARKRLESEVDARYDEQRRTSLARLEPFFTSDPRHQEIRGRLTGRWWDYMRSR